MSESWVTSENADPLADLRGTNIIVEPTPRVVDSFIWTADHYQRGEPQWIVDAIKQGDVSFVDSGKPNVKMKIKRGDRVVIALRGSVLALFDNGRIEVTGQVPIGG